MSSKHRAQSPSPIQWGARSSRPVASPGPSGFHGSPNAASTPLRPPRANANTPPPASPCPSSTSSISSLSSISTIHSLSPQPQPKGKGFQAGQTLHSQSTGNAAYTPGDIQRSTKTRYFQDGTGVKYVKSMDRMQVPLREGHVTSVILDQKGGRIFQNSNLYQQDQRAGTARQYCQIDYGDGTSIQQRTTYCSPPRTRTASQQSPSNASGVRSFGTQTAASFYQHQQEQHHRQQSPPEMAKRSWWWWGTR